MQPDIGCQCLTTTAFAGRPSEKEASQWIGTSGETAWTGGILCAAQASRKRVPYMASNTQILTARPPDAAAPVGVAVAQLAAINDAECGTAAMPPSRELSP